MTKNWIKRILILSAFVGGVFAPALAQSLYTVSPLPFNTREYDEFAAVPYNDGVVFCSNRAPSLFISRVDSANHSLLDLYFVRKKANQKWGTPESFSNVINTQYHEGPATFGNNGKTMMFSQNTPDFEGIFTAVSNGNGWGQITPFIYNTPNAMTGHPNLSADGKRLFFISNRKGGFGGFDIYGCNLVRNRWSTPKNLGPEINSAVDELYPFYCSNGRLYFASNRKNGMGGLDIYYSREVNGKWTRPILLPAPINSPEDDFAYTADTTDRQGYISSTRNNRNRVSDIFEFRMNFPVFVNKAKLQEKNTYTYEFFEQSTINTDTTSFLYEWDFGDKTKIRGKSLEVEHTFAKPGDYLVQLNVIDTLTGQLYKNQAANLFPVRDVEQPFITCRDTVIVGQPVLFDASKTYLPEVQSQEYYWDFSDGELGQGKSLSHSFAEPGLYRIYLGVTGQDATQQKTVVASYRDIWVIKPLK
ncbi:MAG: PKD domain-containing protein [Bacteroidota bacterium]|nr:PKD domain-containing protein [Bacteroidota bacterium]